ncbi:hypothetical protein NDU88_000070 [Pleurodeles waltl]|uniref:Uncharacterized protein n=1 Tax=Pleurodeles waltl TaxID=8319 RepID=A0AAV7USD9_PLEWA|nr:hypothetical protein NDU88_000070 [Pleurodeles waltl]
MNGPLAQGPRAEELRRDAGKFKKAALEDQELCGTCCACWDDVGVERCCDRRYLRGGLAGVQSQIPEANKETDDALMVADNTVHLITLAN